ncbi:MAG: glycoside hydrolase family 18 protein, partial [Fibrobacterota bacterium]
MKPLRVVLSLVLLMSMTQLTSARTVLTWVPPYNMQACETMLATDFGGVTMTDGLTHVALQFWGPDTSDGSIRYVTHEWQTPTDADVQRIRDNMQSAGVKAMLCVYNNNGTWNWDLVEPILTDPAKRSNFVASLTAEMVRLNLDGVEVDLEYPHGTTANYNQSEFYTFIEELTDSVQAHGGEVTVATFAADWSEPKQSWWNDLISRGVAGVTSMGYEEIGMSAAGWAAYSSQTAAINEPGKLMLGMPTYAGGSWQGNTTYEQVSWAVDNGVGIGIWDASLADGAGNAEPSWRTAEIWNKIAEIKNSNATTWTISASAETGGSITPSGSVSITEGSDTSFS